MIDLDPIKKTASYWVFLELIEELRDLQDKVEELERNKADRRGRKPKGDGMQEG